MNLEGYHDQVIESFTEIICSKTQERNANYLESSSWFSFDFACWTNSDVECKLLNINFRFIARLMLVYLLGRDVKWDGSKIHFNKRVRAGDDEEDT